MEHEVELVSPGHIDLHVTGDEDGSTTAEFAIVTLAAVAFAGLLVSILSSGDVRGMLMGLIRQALSF
ncbi:DUF4244 domain-containing protein [Paeniglutamicibacter sp. NPDC012692]|uniref:DUF4244 domain-containing protein n=1 Tax=Paeniglutamicibacter sp. NPDC012692 TaxID=3364388 RepID=UPI0036A39F1F